MTKEEILKIIEEKNINLIRCVFVGFDGISRGRVVLAKDILSSLENGAGISESVQAFNALDHLIPDGRYSPVGEVWMIPDMETFTVLPYTQNSAVMLCDFQTADKKPWEACVRTLLKKIVKQAEAMGYFAQCAIESEFYLLKMKDDELKPYDETYYSSVAGMDATDKVISEIIACLEAMGVSVEKYHPEYGPGQHEIVIHHSDPLKAADTHVIVKDAIKGVAANNGLVASFMPKPFTDKSGSGAHLHISLFDEKGKNLLHDANGHYELSPTGYHFIGGVLAHLRGLLGITAAIVTSYKRLSPGSWASAFSCFGPQNREAAIRICGCSHNLKLNLEYKPMDPCCNPYLAIGAVLAAGLEGIANQIDPGETGVEVPPSEIEPQERERRGILRYPRNLGHALDELSKDTFLAKVMGDVIFEEYIKVKRSEWEAYMAHVSDWEIRNYLTVF